MGSSRSMGRDFLHRWEGNPAITMENIPFRANTVFNGTPIVTEEGVHLLFRVEGQQGYSVFALGRSRDGLRFDIDEKPVLLPAHSGPFSKYEARGIEDPRATVVEGSCYVLYTAVSKHGYRIALAKTEEGVSFERMGFVSEPGNKDGVLFPRKIKGRYARLDRPIGNGRGSIWVSYSPDLLNWGGSELVMMPRDGYWDNFRIGASVPPIETKDGWLEIYHGTSISDWGPIYRIGTALLDIDDPSKVIKRGSMPILSPREDYERIGDVPNVCFACGAVVGDDGNMKVYYGAADTSICVALCSMADLLAEGFE